MAAGRIGVIARECEADAAVARLEYFELVPPDQRGVGPSVDEDDGRAI